MNFWEALPNATISEISRGWKMGTTRKKTIVKLAEWYGDEPTADFIRDAWNVLREGWLHRSSGDRDKVVAFLREGNKGDMSIKINSRAGQLRYLASVRRTQALLDFVLSVLKDSAHAYQEQQTNFATPASKLAQEGNDVEPKNSYAALAERFLKFSDKTIESVEHTALFAILTSLQQIEFPVQDAHKSSKKVEFDVIAALIPDTAWEEQTVDLLDYQKLILDNTDTSTWSEKDIVRKVHTYRQFVQSIFEGEDTDWVLIRCYLCFLRMMFFDIEYEFSQEFIEGVIKGVERFFDSSEEQEENRERGLSLDELLVEALAQFPNSLGPQTLENGVLAWLLNSGSAQVSVFREPYQEKQPMRIMLRSFLLENPTKEQGILETLNNLNKQTFWKFYYDDSVICMEESFVSEFNSPNFYVWKIMNFLAAADNYDSNLKELFGGTLAGEDAKAEFDA
jgi:hypothetical protein